MSRRVRSRRAAGVFAVILLAGCSAGAGQAGTAAPTPSPSPAATASLAPADLTVQAVDGGSGGALGAFAPDKVEIKSGGVLRLDDAGQFEHNLTIDTSGQIPSSVAARSDNIVIAVDLVNRSAEATINLPPGTYRFYCTIDFGVGGHTSLNGTGMVGTLVVH